MTSHELQLVDVTQKAPYLFNAIVLDNANVKTMLRVPNALNVLKTPIISQNVQVRSLVTYLIIFLILLANFSIFLMIYCL